MQRPGAGWSLRDVGASGVFEVEVLRPHIARVLRLQAYANRVDPVRWRPLMMSFQRFFVLGEDVQPSRPAIDEERCRWRAEEARVLSGDLSRVDRRPGAT